LLHDRIKELGLSARAEQLLNGYEVVVQLSRHRWPLPWTPFRFENELLKRIPANPAPAPMQSAMTKASENTREGFSVDSRPALFTAKGYTTMDATSAGPNLRVIPPGLPSPCCSDIVELRPVSMSYFEGSPKPCPKCSKPLDVYEMIFQALMRGGFD